MHSIEDGFASASLAFDWQSLSCQCCFLFPDTVEEERRYSMDDYDCSAILSVDVRRTEQVLADEENQYK